jgi:hypothetical protein
LTALGIGGAILAQHVQHTGKGQVKVRVYFNEVAEADLDFPKIPELSPPSDPQQP